MSGAADTAKWRQGRSARAERQSPGQADLKRPIGQGLRVMKTKPAPDQAAIELAPRNGGDQTGSAAHKDYILQALSEEMKMVSHAISERNQYSTQIKQWCLTLWLAAWGIASLDDVSSFLGDDKWLTLFSPCVFPPCFLILDLINKRNERKFTFRARLITRFLNSDRPDPALGGTSLGHFLASGTLGEFLIYDPGCMNWYKNKAGSDGAVEQGSSVLRSQFQSWISLRSVFLGGWGLKLFYLSLFGFSLFAALLLLTFQQPADPA
jgi:hypothetical protein